MNINGYERAEETNRTLCNYHSYEQHQQRETTHLMPIGEMMERARLTAMNTNNSQSRSSTIGNNGISSQFLNAIQRSNQIPIIDNHPNQPSTIQLDKIVSPLSPLSSHHHYQSRQNRPSKHYPRPPLLNTWQGRGSGHDEFAGMMTDRDKQWVVKIQLHQVSQTEEEVINQFVKIIRFFKINNGLPIFTISREYFDQSKSF